MQEKANTNARQKKNATAMGETPHKYLTVKLLETGYLIC